MKLFIIQILTLILSSYSQASSFSNPVKIESVEYKASGQLVIKFSNLSQENFGSSFPKNVTKLRFDYLNWSPESRNSAWWYKVLPWTKTHFETTPYESCINWMLKNFKEGKSFPIGQKGGGKFEMPPGISDEVIVPYLWSEKLNSDGEQVCLIDLG